LITVTLICRNEAKNIRACLQSVKWADEIIVVDAESIDGTPGMAKEFTDKIFVKDWEGYASQREFALKQASHDWVFAIDADERCSPELKEEILGVIKSKNTEENGFRIPRKSFFLNKWIKHCGWYPGYQMRLFRRENVIVSERLIHEGYKAEGKTGTLKNDLLHYTVNTIGEFMGKINHYSTLRAQEKIDKQKIKMSGLIFRPFAAYFQQFILKKGFMDGAHGVMVTNFDVITNMLTYMKIWEMQNKEDYKKTV
jgi:glycosyltransferase involved in cell wall biosynthesis